MYSQVTREPSHHIAMHANLMYSVATVKPETLTRASFDKLDESGLDHQNNINRFLK